MLLFITVLARFLKSSRLVPLVNTVFTTGIIPKSLATERKCMAFSKSLF